MTYYYHTSGGGVVPMGGNYSGSGDERGRKREKLEHKLYTSKKDLRNDLKDFKSDIEILDKKINSYNQHKNRKDLINIVLTYYKLENEKIDINNGSEDIKDQIDNLTGHIFTYNYPALKIKN